MLVAGVLYQRRGATMDAQKCPPPGRLIGVGDTMLHADVAGAGPPVIFEAGIAATSLSWRLIQPEIATFAQTVSYDRAGLGWSDSSRKPREIWQLVEELRDDARPCASQPRRASWSRILTVVWSRWVMRRAIRPNWPD